MKIVACTPATRRWSGRCNPCAAQSGYHLTPEEASQTYPLRSLALGRQTGGLDEDGRPGDEALQVLVEPRDADGHTLKVPGTLVIRTLEITPEGIKKPLSAWEISGDPFAPQLAQWVVQHGL